MLSAHVCCFKHKRASDFAGRRVYLILDSLASETACMALLPMPVKAVVVPVCSQVDDAGF